MIRSILLAVVLATAAPASLAVKACKDACLQLMNEGHALEAEGKINQALEKYDAAARAFPQSSFPHSSRSGLLLRAAAMVPPADGAKLLSAARASAYKALEIAPDDPLAQEAVRALTSDGSGPPIRRASGAVEKLISEGEAFFSRGRIAEARKKYEEAMVLDPQLSTAWVYAGDCYYKEGEWEKAEALFRRATEIEPRNSQAFRFLSDALLQQGKAAAAEDALFAAIAAHPGQRYNWAKLEHARSAAGLPLKSLLFQRGSEVKTGADGKLEIGLDGDLQKKDTRPDAAFRLMLAVAEVHVRTADKERKLTPFEIELKSWELALRVADETGAKSGDKLTDPALRHMQAMAKDGQLRPALLVLTYKEAYRPELESWTAANPKGLRQFIDRYGLRP